MPELVDAAPEEMLQAVGYYGPAAPAPAAFARLSAGLDEAIVRIITARPGLEPVGQAMAALTPALIRAVGELPPSSSHRPFSSTSRAPLPEQVSVAVVPGVLLDHVDT